MKPHKHAELIKAWADGAEIEVNMPDVNGDAVWEYFNGTWNEDLQYRIKPEPRFNHKDIMVGGFNLRFWEENGQWVCKMPEWLLEVFEKETGEPKSAEVLK